MISGVRASSIQDRVDLVDDGEGMAALHAVLCGRHHVVAQVVEAELRIGAVGDVGGIGFAAQRRRHVVQNDARVHAQEAVDAAGVFGIALGQIVVHGDDVRVAAVERVEEACGGGDERLALAGLHFGDAAVVERQAADQLHVVVAHAGGAAARLADEREGFDDQVLLLFARRGAFAQGVGHRAQFGVGLFLQRGFGGVDGVYQTQIGLEEFVVAESEELRDKCRHECAFSRMDRIIGLIQNVHCT